MAADNPMQTTAMPGFSLAGLCAGFDDPVQESQQLFRAVLTALSEPGSRHDLAACEAPEGVHSAAYQVCLALLDAETRLWIAPSLRTPALVSALRFHCGCPLVEKPEDADFVLTTPDFDGDLNRFSQGSHEYPDRSCTLIVQVESLDGARDWTLSGPGIEGVRQVGIAGLDPRWPTLLADNRSRFPCGVDFLFTAGQALMGLPRTTLVEVSPCM